MDKFTITRFNKAPVLGHKRTTFDCSFNHSTTFNTGDFVPVLLEPIYPGDTVSLKTLSLTRLETSLHQTMDNAYIEFAFFFVPSQLINEDFDKILGANDDPWTQSNHYIIPRLWLTHGSNAGGDNQVHPQSLLHQMGIPVSSYGPPPGTADASYQGNNIDISLHYLRSVFQCYNDWYRDENFDSIVYFAKGSYDQFLGDTFLFNGAPFNPQKDILKVNRFKDVFSTALPAPQRGQDTVVNIMDNTLLPVGIQMPATSISGTVVSQSLQNYSGNIGDFDPLRISTSSNQNMPLLADASGATAVTINQLRLAIVRQAMKERDARGGTRLNEKIASVYNIRTNDLEIGRSEFLGGKRIPINMLEVLQTSETGNTVLGSDAGHSKTLDASASFVKSFTLYGYLCGFMYTRTSRSYSQGIHRKFFEKEPYDLLDPMLDNIGEVPIYKSELYCIKNPSDQSTAKQLGFMDVWGYQEQYYWFKERTNTFSGYFQPGITGTLDSWHYGDNYSQLPSLSASWLKEGPENVDRTIAVQSSASFQWSANIHFDFKVTRELSKYSIPNTFGF